MLHFRVENSGNLETVVDFNTLCAAIRAEAAAIKAFPTPEIRVHASQLDYDALADEIAKHGFINMSVQIREWCVAELKRDAVHRVFELLKAEPAPALAEHSIAMSIELRNMNGDLSLKSGRIRDFLGRAGMIVPASNVAKLDGYLGTHRPALNSETANCRKDKHNGCPLH